MPHLTFDCLSMCGACFGDRSSSLNVPPWYSCHGVGVSLSHQNPVPHLSARCIFPRIVEKYVNGTWRSLQAARSLQAVFQTHAYNWLGKLVLSHTPLGCGVIFEKLRTHPPHCCFLDHEVSATFLNRGQLVPKAGKLYKSLLRRQQHTLNASAKFICRSLTMSGGLP